MPSSGHVHREGREPQREHRAPAEQRDALTARAPRRPDRRLGFVHLRPRLAQHSYEEMSLALEIGQTIEREDLLRALTRMQYTRNNLDFRRGTFRARGDVDRGVSLLRRGSRDPAGSSSSATRSRPCSRSTRCAARSSQDLPSMSVYPSGHYVTPEDRIEKADGRSIEEELDQRLIQLRRSGEAA